MALQTKEDWTKFVIAAGIPPEESATYVSGFANNRVTESSLPDLRKEYLKDLGITIIGNIITILRHIAQSHLPVSKNSVTIINQSNSHETIVKSTNISPP